MYVLSCLYASCCIVRLSVVRFQLLCKLTVSCAKTGMDCRLGSTHVGIKETLMNTILLTNVMGNPSSIMEIQYISLWTKEVDGPTVSLIFLKPCH